MGGFVGGELRSGLRRKDTVINRFLLTSDADYADEDFWEQIELFFNFGIMPDIFHTQAYCTNPRD